MTYELILLKTCLKWLISVNFINAVYNTDYITLYGRVSTHSEAIVCSFSILCQNF